jgi:hypothetical protein
METFPNVEVGEDYYEGSSDYPSPSQFAVEELDDWRGCAWDEPEDEAA